MELFSTVRIDFFVDVESHLKALTVARTTKIQLMRFRYENNWYAVDRLNRERGSTLVLGIGGIPPCLREIPPLEESSRKSRILHGFSATPLEELAESWRPELEQEEKLNFIDN